MAKEYVYCAVDKNEEIIWVLGSSRKTRYFKITNYLAGAVKYHNRYHPDNPWRIVKFELVKVAEQTKF